MLTPKKARFAKEYLANGLNATEAAKASGFSVKTAYSQGQRLLKDVEVARLIASQTEKVMTKLDISVERTLNEVGRLAFLDVRKLFESDGSLKQIDKLDDDSAACIAGLEVSDIWDSGEGEQKSIIGTLKKIKLSDKGAALDKLMRYHSLYKDKVEVSLDSELAEALSRARKRVR